MQTPLDTAAWRQYLWRNTVTNAVTNALANGLICWLLFRDKTQLEFWNPSGGFALDLLITGFLLAVIVTLILIPIQRKQLTADSLAFEVLSAPTPLTQALVTLTESYFRFVVLAASFGLIAAAATLLLLQTVSIHSFTPMHYSVFKGLWAGVFAGILAYLIINLTGRRTFQVPRDEGTL